MGSWLVAMHSTLLAAFATHSRVTVTPLPDGRRAEQGLLLLDAGPTKPVTYPLARKSSLKSSQPSSVTWDASLCPRAMVSLTFPTTPGASKNQVRIRLSPGDPKAPESENPTIQNEDHRRQTSYAHGHALGTQPACTQVIKSFIAHTKPVWWSLHTDAHEIWCRDSDLGTSLGRSIPCPPALCSVRKIHLRPLVVRPTSPRNISPISNPELATSAGNLTTGPRNAHSPGSLLSRVPSVRDPTENWTVPLTWQPFPAALELWPKVL
ncbi:uncharacterized protein LOC131381103 [Hylobates moloch]|uniref:uncharacterized protein LOC131381103 n=1 Tax=Hylobates moloch TaxID=81572 RepID=UPI0026759AF7|nr:uncharacterized protein LOC131381103 [Hylobates moloch]